MLSAPLRCFTSPPQAAELARLQWIITAARGPCPK